MSATEKTVTHLEPRLQRLRYRHRGRDATLEFDERYLYERWRTPSGEWLESCVLLTTEANDRLRAVHDRMPVILPRDAYGPWLDPDERTPDRLLPLLRPVLPDIGRLSRENLTQDSAQSKHICPFIHIVDFTQRLLGGHISRRSHYGAHLGL